MKVVYSDRGQAVFLNFNFCEKMRKIIDNCEKMRYNIITKTKGNTPKELKMKVPIKGKHTYQVYGEYGGEFTNYKEAMKCAREASKYTDCEIEIWIDNSTWYDSFKNGKLVK